MLKVKLTTPYCVHENKSVEWAYEFDTPAGQQHQVTTKESQEEMNILSKTISSLENLSGEESPTKE